MTLELEKYWKFTRNHQVATCKVSDSDGKDVEYVESELIPKRETDSACRRATISVPSSCAQPHFEPDVSISDFRAAKSIIFRSKNEVFVDFRSF